jgi:hypothetical protein
VELYELKDDFRVAERALEYLPDSRERSLAFTNLEQAFMWAEKALERHGSTS